MLFADHLVLLATSENNLQRYVYNLDTIETKNNMEISTEKANVLVF